MNVEYRMQNVELKRKGIKHREVNEQNLPSFDCFPFSSKAYFIRRQHPARENPVKVISV
jgi:hypothetical protein